MIDAPTVRRGLSERYGSWNTICTLAAQRRQRAARWLLPRERPSAKMSPPVGSISRAMQRATVDLPEPDSPTMPTRLAAAHRQRHVLRGVHRAAPGRASRR